MDLWLQSVLLAALSEACSTFQKQIQTESTEVPPCHVVTVSPGASGHPQRGQSHTQGQEREQGGVMATTGIKGFVPEWPPWPAEAPSCPWQEPAPGWPGSLCPPCAHPLLAVPSCPQPASPCLPLLLIPLITAWPPFPCGMSAFPNHTESFILFFIPFHSLHTSFPQGHSAEPPLLWRK